jgi:hypothetical protein
MDKYIAEKIKPFGVELCTVLQTVGTGMAMRDVAKHVREKREAFHELWTRRIDDCVGFWDGQVEGILSAECKLEESDTGYGTAYGFSLITKAGSLLRNFWDGAKDRDEARSVFAAKPSMHLHKYPKYVAKLVAKYRAKLESIKTALIEKLSAFEEALFDVAQPFLKMSEDETYTRVNLTFDCKDAKSTVIGILMTRGPTNDSIPGFERGTSLDGEVEECQQERAECQKTIAKLEKAAAEISELFPVRCSLHRFSRLRRALQTFHLSVQMPCFSLAFPFTFPLRVRRLV